jgi:hypothetical protein
VKIIRSIFHLPYAQIDMPGLGYMRITPLGWSDAAKLRTIVSGSDEADEYPIECTTWLAGIGPMEPVRMTIGELVKSLAAAREAE